MAIKKCRIASLREELASPIDVFICCGSYEERCLSVGKSIDPDAIGKAIIAENRDLSVHVGQNTENLRKLFAGKHVDALTNSGDPLETADNLRDSLMSVASEKALKYLVDITTFTHEGLLILLKVLSLVAKREDSVQFVYTSALDYGREEGGEGGDTEHEDRWLSKGVAEVRSVLGYAGKVLPSRKTHLIVLVGYEHQRASKLIEVFEPNVLSLGHGKAGSETSEKHWVANEYYCKLVRETAATYTTVRDFDFSCSNPWEAKNAILERVACVEDYNVIVAPMNTKISTVGSALATIQNEAIQLCYAKAMHYNYRYYSIPGEMCYLFELPELFEK